MNAPRRTPRFTEACLAPNERDDGVDPSQPGFLSPDELAALKASGDFDPEFHNEDGSMNGFSPAEQKARRDEILAHLNRLHPALQDIVDAELKRGNFVHDASADYPEPGSVFVAMSQRFTEQYANAERRFVLLQDPHYWWAEYSAGTAPQHLLVC